MSHSPDTPCLGGCRCWCPRSQAKEKQTRAGAWCLDIFDRVLVVRQRHLALLAPGVECLTLQALCGIGLLIEVREGKCWKPPTAWVQFDGRNSRLRRNRSLYRRATSGRLPWPWDRRSRLSLGIPCCWKRWPRCVDCGEPVWSHTLGNERRDSHAQAWSSSSASA